MFSPNRFRLCHSTFTGRAVWFALLIVALVIKMSTAHRLHEMSGEYRKVEWRLVEDAAQRKVTARDGVLALSPAEWRAQMEQLRRVFDLAPDGVQSTAFRRKSAVNAPPPAGGTPNAVSPRLLPLGKGGPLQTHQIFQPIKWMPQMSGTTNELRSVHFTSASEGWVAGSHATLLHTTNGGTSWTAVNTGVDPAKGFNTVRFLDQNAGLVNGSPTLARTTNGGANCAPPH